MIVVHELRIADQACIVTEQCPGVVRELDEALHEPLVACVGLAAEIDDKLVEHVGEKEGHREEFDGEQADQNVEEGQLGGGFGPLDFAVCGLARPQLISPPEHLKVGLYAYENCEDIVEPELAAQLRPGYHVVDALHAQQNRGRRRQNLDLDDAVLLE